MSKERSKSSKDARRHTDQRAVKAHNHSMAKLIDRLSNIEITGKDDYSAPKLPTSVAAHLSTTSPYMKADDAGYTSDTAGFADTEADFNAHRTRNKIRQNRPKATNVPYGAKRMTKASKALDERIKISKVLHAQPLPAVEELPPTAVDELAVMLKTKLDTIHDIQFIATMRVLNDPSVIITCSSPVFTPQTDRLEMASVAGPHEDVAKEPSPAPSNVSLPSLEEVLRGPSPFSSQSSSYSDDSVGSMTLPPIHRPSRRFVKENRNRRVSPYSSNKNDRKKSKAPKTSREEQIVEKLSKKSCFSDDIQFVDELGLNFEAQCEHTLDVIPLTYENNYLPHDHYLKEFAGFSASMYVPYI